jgi:hypothetical protein
VYVPREGVRRVAARVQEGQGLQLHPIQALLLLRLRRKGGEANAVCASLFCGVDRAVAY